MGTINAAKWPMRCSRFLSGAAVVLLLLTRAREGLGNGGGVVVVTGMVETLSVQKIKKTAHPCRARSSAARSARKGGARAFATPKLV
jgi:hypothetical protein